MRIRQALRQFYLWQYLAFMVAIGSVYFVTVNLNNLNGISWGWDFAVLYTAVSTFFSQGTLYENPLNFNFPFASLFLLPYQLVPLTQAAIIKLAVMILLSGCSVFLMIKIEKRILSSNLDRFLFALLALEFFSIQFYTLNIYVEVLFLLLLSLFMYQKNRPNVCAFLLALVIVTKIFLLPLLLFPAVLRRYRLVLVTSIFILMCIIISAFIFGKQSNLEAIDIIFKKYPRIFFACCSDANFSPISSGYVDLFNRLFFVGCCSRGTARNLAGIYTVVYMLMVLFVVARMWQTVVMQKAGMVARRMSYSVFASLLVFSIFYKFRLDISLLLIGMLPWYANLEQPRLKKSIVVAAVLISINHHFLVGIFETIHLEKVASLLSKFFYLFPPQLFGISIMLVSIIIYWEVLRKELVKGSSVVTEQSGMSERQLSEP